MIGDWLARVRKDDTGSVLVEFAIIGPAMLAMMLAVFHIGIGMQNYNAMRSIAAETARHAIVNYQTGNKLSNLQLADHAKTVGISPPYSLQYDRLAANVSDAAVQRVSGAKELTVTLTYRVPTVLAVIGIGDIPMSFSRPIFVITSPTT